MISLFIDTSLEDVSIALVKKKEKNYLKYMNTYQENIPYM